MFEFIIEFAPEVVVFLGVCVLTHCLVQLSLLQKKMAKQKREQILSLKARLDLLRLTHGVFESKQIIVKELAVNYFNSMEPKSHRAIHELDTLMNRTKQQIRSIEEHIEQCTTLSIKRAEKMMGHLQKQDSFVYPSLDKKRKATWEMRVEQLIKLSGENIKNASERARALGLQGRPNKFRKPTHACLQEIKVA
jgi:glutaredoxin 2